LYVSIISCIIASANSHVQVWDKASAATEIAQGKAIADASVAASVTLLIWSSLPNISRISGGALTEAVHFDSKAEVEEYIRGLPILSTFFMAGWFMQNHIKYMRPKLVSLVPNMKDEI